MFELAPVIALDVIGVTEAGARMETWGGVNAGEQPLPRGVTGIPVFLAVQYEGDIHRQPVVMGRVTGFGR